MADPLDRWQHDDSGRTVTVSVTDDGLVISNRYLDMEFTERQAEWLQAMALPAALSLLRRRQEREFGGEVA